MKSKYLIKCLLSSTALVWLSGLVLVIGLRCGINTPLAGGTTDTGNSRVACIVHNSDGTPAVNATVRLRTTGYLVPAGLGKLAVQRSDAVTDEGGRFVLDSLDTGSYRIEVNTNSGYALLVDCRIASPIDTVDLGIDTVQKAAFIQGTSNAAVNGKVQVYGLERLASVDSNGNFLIADLPAGTYSIRLVAAQSAYQPVVIDSVTAVAGDTAVIQYTDYYVSTTGSDANDGSRANPWATISHAAIAVGPGAVVHIAPGQYNEAVVTSTSGTVDARIRFISDSLWGAIISVSGTASVWENTGNYIDIEGFSITSPDSSGSGPRIGIDNTGSYCRIIKNHVHHIAATAALTGSLGGAGIASGGYPPWNTTVTNGNQIVANVIDHIGNFPERGSQIVAMNIRDSAAVVWNNICYNNSGSGIFTWHAATNLLISNNLCFRNMDDGIAIGAGDLPTGSICDNSLISNNIAINNQGYGISESGPTGGANVYLNNCVYGNQLGAFRLQNGITDRNTITADAQFVNYQSDGTGDYHLTAASPCIDVGTPAGAPSSDFGYQLRPQGGGFDVGPFEFAP